MCNRSDRIPGVEVPEVVTIHWRRVWETLMTRHGPCRPSRDCLVDAIWHSVVSDYGE